MCFYSNDLVFSYVPYQSTKINVLSPFFITEILLNVHSDNIIRYTERYIISLRYIKCVHKSIGKWKGCENGVLRIITNIAKVTVMNNKVQRQKSSNCANKKKNFERFSAFVRMVFYGFDV